MLMSRWITPGITILTCSVAVMSFAVLTSCFDVDDENGFVVESGNTETPSTSDVGFGHGRDVLRLHSGLYDVAYVRFRIDELSIGRQDRIQVWMKTDICIGCKMVAVANLTIKTKEKKMVATIDTAWATRIMVTTGDVHYPAKNNTYCELYYHFGQYGEYNLTVPPMTRNNTNGTICDLETLKSPTYANTSVFVFYGSVFLMFFVAAFWVHCIKRCNNKGLPSNHNGNVQSNVSLEDQTPLTDPVGNKPTKTSLRLRSVDAFRGLAITNLVLGTSGDGHFWYLSHARWYGITVADFMFPWFVFIMGTSIHLSFNILLSKGQSYLSIFKKIIFRSISLFIMGVCIQPHNDLRTLRIPGVLQRFGITYFIVASSYLLSRRLQARRIERTGKCYMMFRDVTDYLELPLAFCFLTVHLCLTFLLPVPGCPLGYQGPGGPLVGENGELTNCTGGASGYIDRMFFTEAHIINIDTCSAVYRTIVKSDPEGILGSFTSIALCVFGLQAGKILHLFTTVRGRCLRLIIWGLVLISCSLILCKASMADGWIPLNKNLWSVSFIALTGGTAFIIQALFHILIDVTHFWNGAPLFYAGMNSILLYIGSEIMHPYLPFSWVPFVGNHTEYIILAAWSGFLWLAIAYLCYRKKIFLKL
ncbi:heparan-alpha-glucosaminide N-acetyltransferase-like isoform X2 [Lytechinus variegatus]|uniref:heparan-alpha-glucosaminide N-acetyltransferase-like isoform X2 n=1 Tax=Lytechinus variegatus TaxID=7654 RepID=UPI001BB25E60|nr:heparan-alpha-glucosaminide N-acetyltransferase-like isoform X2 [Lytechinus variegatus]